MKRLYNFIVVAVLIAWNSPGAALTISDIDLASFDFDVIDYAPGGSNGLTGNATASGTSNGVGWSISPTNLWVGRTVTNGTFDFAALPNPTDNLHPSIAFTITFDQRVDDLLVALSNNGAGTDSINFGVAPTDVVGVSVFGTQILLNEASGGLALFENLDTLTIHHTNTNFFDGFDLAFHVVSTVGQGIGAVPEPGALALLGIGLVGLVGFGAGPRSRD